MRVFRSLEEARSQFAPSVISIGNFDGVHIGHRELLRRVKVRAAKTQAKPSVITFHPHPAQVVAPERAPLLLTTPEERVALMAVEGIEQVLIVPFDESVASLEPVQFIDRVVAGIAGARAVVVGDNFRFGRRQAGNIATLRELAGPRGIEVEVVHPVPWRGAIVSSSAIRRLIQAGNVSRAARMLARPYALSGDVVPGEGRGSKQTVPTLNLKWENAVLPATGVYITRTTCLATGSIWPSITNIGYRPTFAGKGITVETFLLTPLAAETPRRIQVDFLRRMREERAFPDAVALKSQILQDVARAQAFHRRISKSLKPEACRL